MERQITHPSDDEIDRAFARISEAPGTTIVICGDLIGPLINDLPKGRFFPTFFVGAAAKLIREPASAENLPTTTIAGLETVLSGYRHDRLAQGAAIEAFEPLLAHEEAGTLEAWVLEGWKGCPISTSAYREAQTRQAETGGDVILIQPDPVASAQERPWGEAVPDGAQEALALELLGAIAAGTANGSVLSVGFVIGPALYGDLREAESDLERDDLATIGTSSTNMVHTSTGMISMEMRSFLNEKDIRALLGLSLFRGIALVLSEGRSRSATERERALWYSLIPIETAGKAVTLIEAKGHVFVTYIEDGKLRWMDALSSYDGLQRRPH